MKTNKTITRKIVHIDMDAFFASAEQHHRPELRGKPVIVGGNPQRRGVVSTCSYEARKYGIHSGMASISAMRLCPEAIFIEPDFRRYQAISRKIRKEFFALTDLVEPMSIDEAYLDVTEKCATLEDAEKLAEYLQQRIFERTGLTASAGISYNKFLAKCASDFRKPAGRTLITPSDAEAFLDDLTVDKFHGIGKVSAAKLRTINVKTGRDLRKLPLETLKSLFGKAGAFYYGIVRGIDNRPVELEGDPKSISKEHTLHEDCTRLRHIRITLRALSLKVARRAKEKNFAGRSVFIKLKYADFRTVTRTVTLTNPVSDGVEIGNIAVSLLSKTEAGRVPVRLVGAGIGQLINADDAVMVQQELDFNGRKG